MLSSLTQKLHFPTFGTGPSSQFKKVKNTGPKTSEDAQELRVTKPDYWAAAKLELGMSSAPRALTRQDLAKPAVVNHLGQAFAQNHLGADKQPRPISALKTGYEAEDGWERVLIDVRLSERSCVAPKDALKLTRSLHRHLWQSTPQRLLCDYNSYPEALFVQDDGSLLPKPDLAGSGHHAWFEPLARLDYTSRTERGTLSALIASYSQHRTDVADSIKNTWQDDALRCRVLFDLLYVAYFLRASQPSLNKDMNPEDVADHQARLVTLEARLKDDVEALSAVDRTLPKLKFKDGSSNAQAPKAA